MPSVAASTAVVAAVVLAAALVGGAGCLAFSLPPSRSELGPALVARDGRTQTGVRITTGAHLASAKLDDPAFDVGAGYVFERTSERPTAGDDALAISAPSTHPAPARIGHGAYLDVGRRVAANPHHRAWVGLRGEALWTGLSRAPDVGLAARLSWELFAVGTGAGGFHDGCTIGGAVSSGTTAIGGYVEAGYRVTPHGVTEVVSTAGVSVRLPFVAGMGVSLCPR